MRFLATSVCPKSDLSIIPRGCELRQLFTFKKELSVDCLVMTIIVIALYHSYDQAFSSRLQRPQLIFHKTHPCYRAKLRSCFPDHIMNKTVQCARFVFNFFFMER